MSYFTLAGPARRRASALSGFVPGGGPDRTGTCWCPCGCGKPVVAPKPSGISYEMGSTSYASGLGAYRGLGIPSSAVTTGPMCGGAKNVQNALNDLGYGPLVVDGDIGSGTQRAMAAFCAARGIPKSTWPYAPFCAALKQALVEKEAADAAAAQAAAAAAAQTQGGGGVDPQGLVQGGGGAVDPGQAGGAVDPAAGSSSGLSTETMVIIGVGAVVVLALGAMLMSRGKMQKNPFEDDTWPSDMGCCG